MKWMINKYLPDIEKKELHWSLPNLRILRISDGFGPGKGIYITTDITNPGYADSTDCDVIVRVIEVDSGDDPNMPAAIHHQHDVRTQRLHVLSPKDVINLDFGAFFRVSNAPEMFVYVAIDPATDIHPFGEVHELNKQDNVYSELYEIRQRQEPPFNDQEPAFEDFYGGAPPSYRWYRKVVTNTTTRFQE